MIQLIARFYEYKKLAQLMKKHDMGKKKFCDGLVMFPP